MYFSDSRSHAIPLFVRSGVLPLNMLYFKYSAILMHDISHKRAPSRISESFFPSNIIHSHYTRFSSAGNFYVQRSRLSQLVLSFSRSAVIIWNKIPLTLREQCKDPFKCKLHKLLIKVLETKKVYVDIWVPLPVPTWTPYSIEVFSFLISIGATFYLFHFTFCFLFLNFFFRLYRRQLLYWGPLVHKFLPHVLPSLNKVVTYLFDVFVYCCPPRVATLNVGNIVFNYFINE